MGNIPQNHLSFSTIICFHHKLHHSIYPNEKYHLSFSTIICFHHKLHHSIHPNGKYTTTVSLQLSGFTMNHITQSTQIRNIPWVSLQLSGPTVSQSDFRVPRQNSSFGHSMLAIDTVSRINALPREHMTAWGISCSNSHQRCCRLQYKYAYCLSSPKYIRDG